MAASRRVNNPPRLKERRRELRNHSTLAEIVLWNALKGSALHGRKFRRQHGIGPYIVDFYCPTEKLIIELDGAAHDSEQTAMYDQLRERYLRELGLTVIRLDNRHVMEKLEGLLAYIGQHLLSG